MNVCFDVQYLELLKASPCMIYTFCETCFFKYVCFFQWCKAAASFWRQLKWFWPRFWPWRELDLKKCRSCLVSPISTSWWSQNVKKACRRKAPGRALKTIPFLRPVNKPASVRINILLFLYRSAPCFTVIKVGQCSWRTMGKGEFPLVPNAGSQSRPVGADVDGASGLETGW